MEKMKDLFLQQMDECVEVDIDEEYFFEQKKELIYQNEKLFEAMIYLLLYKKLKK